jgi:hypothetical protein
MSASAAFIGDHEANVADNITPFTIVTLIAGVFPAWQQCSHSTSLLWQEVSGWLRAQSVFWLLWDVEPPLRPASDARLRF